MTDAETNNSSMPANSAQLPTSSFSETTKRWSKWASTFFKKERPLGGEPWFNPEADTKQKREWIEQQQAQATPAAKWPEHMYENFFVLGLPPDIEITQIAEQLCDLERKQGHHESDAESEHGREHMQPPQPSWAPQVLFRFHAGSSAPISDEEVAALAFPSGVTPEKLKRTPSLSGLDELIMGRDTDAQEQCFVFMLKVGGNFPLYGCCWYVREMLHRSPYLARQKYRNCHAPFRQCMIAAPRCYCLLSHYPFFELHFRVLKIILDLERLERLLEYDTEKSRLPPPGQVQGTVPSGLGSAASKTSSKADMSVLSQSMPQPKSTSQGRLTTAAAGGPAAKCMSRGNTIDAQSCVPAVHNRQGYCNDCAGIIEDMCPFTPGVSPVISSPLQQRITRCQHQQQQQPQQQHAIMPVQQPPVDPEPNGLQHHQELSQQPGQQMQQQPGLPAAHSGCCEVCGKYIGGLGDNRRDDAMLGAPGTMFSSTGYAVSIAVTPVQPSRPVSEGACQQQQAAATDPLEAGVKQQQQQPPATPGFAPAKSWIASTSLQGTANGKMDAWQSAFDAAAVSGFDDAATADAASGGRMISAAAAGDGQQNHTQEFVVAGQEAVKVHATFAGQGSADQHEDAVLTSQLGTVDAQRETSLVQRMWDVWAPKPSATASADVTPKQSGLAGFFKRVSRASSAQVPAQPEQQEMQPIKTQQQQYEHQTVARQPHEHLPEHLPMQQGRHVPFDYAEAAMTKVVQHGATDNVTKAQGTGLNILARGYDLRTGQSETEVVHYDADAQLPNDLQLQPTAKRTSSVAAASADAPDWANDPSLQPLCSYMAKNNSATPVRSNQYMESAVKPIQVGGSSLQGGETGSGFREKAAAAEASAAAATPPSAAQGGAEELQSIDAAATAGRSGSAVLAARAVHRHSQSEASNASSFYSAVEHPEPAEEAVAAADVQLGHDMQPQVRSCAAGPDHRMQQQSVRQPNKHQQQQVAGDVQRPPPQAAPEKMASTASGGLQSARRSSSDSELLVSAFTSIAAAATPFPTAQVNGLNSSRLSNSSQPAAVPTAVSANEGVQVELRVAAAGESMSGHHSTVQPNRSSSCGAAEAAQALQNFEEVQPTRSQSQPSTPLAGRCPSPALQHGLQPQHQCYANEQRDAMHLKPMSRGSSVRRSLMFEDVALRRSGDMSAELCRTISHLVQVDSHSVLTAYHSSPVPPPGEMYRLMLGDLYRLEFERALPLPECTPPGRSRLQSEVLSYAEVECAQQLQLWTVAALCRSLSIENVITLLNAALLEKQLVVFCPQIGTLAAVVLSLVPLLRPFSWQSLMLPVTPGSMLGFLEAPVPFVLGVQYKTPGVVSRCHGLIRVNVYKDGIKNASLPSLPSSRQLLQALAPHHAALQEAEPMAVERPVYVITPDEEAAARNFLSVLNGYLSQLCGDLRLHTIVNVGMSKKTGVFMKDAFLESVPSKDRPFMKAFTETQMFAVYADGVISDYCES